MTIIEIQANNVGNGCEIPFFMTMRVMNEIGCIAGIMSQMRIVLCRIVMLLLWQLCVEWGVMICGETIRVPFCIRNDDGWYFDNGF